MPEGLVIKGIGGFYYVKTQKALYECKARGIFRKDKIIVLPGDRVEITILDENNKLGNIDEIKKRDNELVRPAVANISQLCLVMAIKSPSPDLGLIDRLLVTAEKKGIKVLLCINKLDLDEAKEHEELLQIYKNAGYKVVLTCSKTKDGFKELESYLKDEITVFAGQSGVGKSTMLNNILDALVMETGAVSDKIERGKHTTRHAELFQLINGGYLVDTPGFSQFEIGEIELLELQEYFPEFEDYRYGCKFKGCSHISEPECKVKKALEEGNISKSRYLRYCQFYNMLKEGIKRCR